MTVKVRVISPGVLPWVGTLTDHHACTSYGVPVLIDQANMVYAKEDLPAGTWLHLVRTTNDRGNIHPGAANFGLPLED